MTGTLSGLCQACYDKCNYEKARKKATAFAEMQAKIAKGGSVVAAVSEERLVIVSDAKMELHFRRTADESQWSMLRRPMKLNPAVGAAPQFDYRHLVEDNRLPGGPCSITSEDFAPLRTAKIHTAFRQEPLEAMQAMQDIMCHLVLFVCRECRIRFPAFHPDFTPDLDLQVTKQCPNAVATWDGDVPSKASARKAPTCTGVCAKCAKELEDSQKDELLKDTTRRSR